MIYFFLSPLNDNEGFRMMMMMMMIVDLFCKWEKIPFGNLLFGDSHHYIIVVS